MKISKCDLWMWVYSIYFPNRGRGQICETTHIKYWDGTFNTYKPHFLIMWSSGEKSWEFAHDITQDKSALRKKNSRKASPPPACPAPALRVWVPDS